MRKVYVGRSSISGTGVHAGKNLRSGEIVLRIDDSRVITRDAPLDTTKGEREYHCDYLANGKVVLMQEPERYINHSCEPNVFVKWIAGERYVITRRDVAKDQEITYDYCIDGSGDTVWECNCGSLECRHTIHSDFFHLPEAKQEEYFVYLSDWYIGENRENFERLKSALGL